MKGLIVGLVVVAMFSLLPSIGWTNPCCYGDYDCNGDVEFSDYLLFVWDFMRGFLGITPTEPCNFALIPNTGQTTFYATGDDGHLQIGVEWPNPRFTDNGDGTVTDNLTDLVWLKDANCISTNYPGFDNDEIAGNGEVTWQHALDFVAGINDGKYSDCGAGFTDWRLPNINELASLVHKGYYKPAVPNRGGTGQWSEGDSFSSVQGAYYWSSTTGASYPLYAWSVYMDNGSMLQYYKSWDSYVWPVRGGQ